jgi:TonB family protein
MKKIVLMTIILLGIAQAVTAQEALIQVRVFQASLSSEKPGLGSPEILSASSDPRLSILLAKVDAPESELRAAALQILTKIYPLDTTAYLFSQVLFWDGKTEILGEPILQPPIAYRLEAAPSWRFATEMNLNLSVYLKEIPSWPAAGSPEENSAIRELRGAARPDFYRKKMDKIFGADVPLRLEDPTLVGIPVRDKVIFLLLMAAERPQPSKTVLPTYPEELIRRGVAGKARFRISVDETGAVNNVRVVASVHPYLDDAACRAIKQWTFEPVIKGREAVKISFDWTIDFDPTRWPSLGSKPELLATGPYSPELKKILEQGAAYAKRLSGAAMDFVCEETIKTTNYAMNLPEKTVTDEVKTSVSSSGGGGLIMVTSGRRILARNPYKTKTNRFICDYQMIKKGERIEERRILMKENGKSVESTHQSLDDKQYAVLRPLFAPLEMMTADRQNLYDFRFVGEETIEGKPAAVIEAVARPGAVTGTPAAKIWIERESFRILQCETQGLPIEGYESVFAEASKIGISPVSTMTTTFGEAKNGVLFPSRVSLRINYPVNVWGIGKRTKIETDIRYDKYKFFSVDTENKIIKSN